MSSAKNNRQLSPATPKNSALGKTKKCPRKVVTSFERSATPGSSHLAAVFSQFQDISDTPVAASPTPANNAHKQRCINNLGPHDTNVNPEILQLMRKMGKRCDVTRRKALLQFLERLETLLNDKDTSSSVNTLASWMPEFCRVYAANALFDCESDLRIGFNTALKLSIEALKRRFTPFVRTVFPALWCSCCDPNAAVAAAAENALQTIVPQDNFTKSIALIEYCREDLVSELVSFISLTESSLHVKMYGVAALSVVPVSTREERYDNIVMSALSALARLIHLLSNDSTKLHSWKSCLEVFFNTDHSTSVDRCLSVTAFRPLVCRSAALCLSSICESYKECGRKNNVDLRLPFASEEAQLRFTKVCLAIFSSSNRCLLDVAPSLFINFAKLYPESLDHALSLKVPALEAGKRSKHHVSCRAIYADLLEVVRHNGYAVACNQEVDFYHQLPVLLRLFPHHSLLGSNSGRGFLRSLLLSLLATFRLKDAKTKSKLALVVPLPSLVLKCFYRIALFILEDPAMCAQNAFLDRNDEDADDVQQLRDGLIQDWFWCPVQLYLRCLLFSEAQCDLLNQVHRFHGEKRDITRDGFTLSFRMIKRCDVVPLFAWLFSQLDTAVPFLPLLESSFRSSLLPTLRSAIVEGGILEPLNPSPAVELATFLKSVWQSRPSFGADVAGSEVLNCVLKRLMTELEHWSKSIDPVAFSASELCNFTTLLQELLVQLGDELCRASLCCNEHQENSEKSGLSYHAITERVLLALELCFSRFKNELQADCCSENVNVSQLQGMMDIVLSRVVKPLLDLVSPDVLCSNASLVEALLRRCLIKPEPLSSSSNGVNVENMLNTLCGSLFDLCVYYRLLETLKVNHLTQDVQSVLWEEESHCIQRLWDELSTVGGRFSVLKVVNSSTVKQRRLLQCAQELQLNVFPYVFERLKAVSSSHSAADTAATLHREILKNGLATGRVTSLLFDINASPTLRGFYAQLSIFFLCTARSLTTSYSTTKNDVPLLLELAVHFVEHMMAGYQQLTREEPFVAKIFDELLPEVYISVMCVLKKHDVSTARDVLKRHSRQIFAVPHNTTSPGCDSPMDRVTTYWVRILAILVQFVHDSPEVWNMSDESVNQYPVQFPSGFWWLFQHYWSQLPRGLTDLIEQADDHSSLPLDSPQRALSSPIVVLGYRIAAFSQFWLQTEGSCSRLEETEHLECLENPKVDFCHAAKGCAAILWLTKLMLEQFDGSCVSRMGEYIATDVFPGLVFNENGSLSSCLGLLKDLTGYVVLAYVASKKRVGATETYEKFWDGVLCGVFQDTLCCVASFLSRKGYTDTATSQQFAVVQYVWSFVLAYALSGSLNKPSLHSSPDASLVSLLVDCQTHEPRVLASLTEATGLWLSGDCVVAVASLDPAAQRNDAALEDAAKDDVFPTPSVTAADLMTEVMAQIAWSLAEISTAITEPCLETPQHICKLTVFFPVITCLSLSSKEEGNGDETIAERLILVTEGLLGFCASHPVADWSVLVEVPRCRIFLFLESVMEYLSCDVLAAPDSKRQTAAPSAIVSSILLILRSAFSLHTKWLSFLSLSDDSNPDCFFVSKCFSALAWCIAMLCGQFKETTNDDVLAQAAMAAIEEALFNVEAVLSHCSIRLAWPGDFRQWRLSVARLLKHLKPFWSATLDSHRTLDASGGLNTTFTSGDAVSVLSSSFPNFLSTRLCSLLARAAATWAQDKGFQAQIFEILNTVPFPWWTVPVLQLSATSELRIELQEYQKTANVPVEGLPWGVFENHQAPESHSLLMNNLVEDIFTSVRHEPAEHSHNSGVHIIKQFLTLQLGEDYANELMRCPVLLQAALLQVTKQTPTDERTHSVSWEDLKYHFSFWLILLKSMERQQVAQDTFVALPEAALLQKSLTSLILEARMMSVPTPVNWYSKMAYLVPRLPSYQPPVTREQESLSIVENTPYHNSLLQTLVELVALILLVGDELPAVFPLRPSSTHCGALLLSDVVSSKNEVFNPLWPNASERSSSAFALPVRCRPWCSASSEELHTRGSSIIDALWNSSDISSLDSSSGSFAELPPTWHSVWIMAAQLAYLVAELFPVALRSFVSAQQSLWMNKKQVDAVHNVFRHVISPYLISRDVAIVSAVGKQSVSEDCCVSTLYHRRLHQIKLHIGNTSDEVVVDITVKFPDVYPLRCPEIQFLNAVGIPKVKVERWILASKQIILGGKKYKSIGQEKNVALSTPSSLPSSELIKKLEPDTLMPQEFEDCLDTSLSSTSNEKILRLLASRDCSIATALQLFKENVVGFIKGLEECAICYSIVFPRTRSLPKKQCITCKYKFHTECLDRWFRTSHKTHCPLCQSTFSNSSSSFGLPNR